MKPPFTSPLQNCSALIIALLIAGCASTPPTTVGPPVPDAAQLERVARIERASGQLASGLREYEGGSFEEALTSLLQALDSGVLQAPQVLLARKHLAFIYCVTNRTPSCKDEFAKALAIDPKFELTAAEAGHPLWGPVYRQSRLEDDARRSGRPLPPPPKEKTAGERLMLDGQSQYEAGEFSKALRSFQDALKEPLALEDLVLARKLSAFCYCLTNRGPLCRAEFEKLLAVKPDFDLAPAEAGHPSWGPSFRSVKNKTKASAKK